eukprot:scaffold59370_cov60-Cyclotella_meneghiniana.AAC.1
MGPLVVGRLSGRAQHPLHSADCWEPLSRQLPTSSESAAGWLPANFGRPLQQLHCQYRPPPAQ